MPPNVEVHEHFNTCAVPYKGSVPEVKNDVNSSTDTGETISLASRRQERLRSQSDEDPTPTHGTVARVTYNLDRFTKNVMLIIHNIFYADGDKAVDKVKTTFEKFRFEVDVLNSKDGTTIISTLKKFFSRDFTEYGCAAVVVVSPVAANGAYKTKRQFFTNDDILNYLKGGVVPTLDGKPKIFITEVDKMMSHEKVCTISDYFNIGLLKRSKPFRGGRLLPPHYLQVFCEKLDELADTHNLTTISTTKLRESLPYERNITETKPCFKVVSALKKELWLWRTA